MNSNYCEKCGAPLLPDSVFCEVCGARVQAAPAQQQIPHQGQWQQPAPQQIPYQGQWQQQPAPRGSGAKIVLIVLAAVVLIAAVFAVLWFTGVLGGRDPGGSGSLPNNISPGEPRTQSDPVSDAGGSPASYSTDEKPTASDFAWFTDEAENLINGFIPRESCLLSADELSGSWKGLRVMFDYDGSYMGSWYFTIKLSCSGSAVTGEITWHQADWSDGSTEDLSGWQKESMDGAYSGESLELGDPGNLMHMTCYELDGAQYAVGRWDMQSGEEVWAAFVRP